MSEVVIQCNNITKRINGHSIIKNLSFNIYEGDILGFIGSNGSGKTTTIKSILGLYKLDKGTVKIMGYDLQKNFVKAISQVGAIIENPDMYMYMSGYENLKISAKIYNISKKRITEIVKLVGLEQRIHDKVSKYSLGMKQRLGIAQAIIHNPKLLILDEPTNGLDPEGIKELKQLLIKLSKTKMAIIVSSHILSELESFCNKICIINNGQIVKYMTMDELKKITKKNNYILKLDLENLDKTIINYEKIDATHIRIKCLEEQLNNIIKTLVLNNINIYELKQEVLSLEEVFLRQIGGNTHD